MHNIHFYDRRQQQARRELDRINLSKEISLAKFKMYLLGVVLSWFAVLYITSK